MLPHCVRLLLIAVLLLLLLLPEATRATNLDLATPLRAAAKHHNGTCREFKNTFSEAEAELVRCAIDHAEPVQFCTGCVNHFVRFEAAWRQLATGNDNLTNASCWAQFVDHDRLNLLLGVRQKAVELWTGADCPNCFQTTSSGRPTNHTTPAASDFYTKLATFDACIRAHQANSTAVICSSCAGEYSDLNTHYTRFVQGSIAETDGVCFDLRDAMNRTRRSWSDEYKCCRDRHESLFAFVLSSLVVGSLPVVFYGVAVAMRMRRDGRELVQLDAQLEQQRRRRQQTTTALTPQSAQAGANDADDDVALLGSAQPMGQSGAVNGVKRKPVGVMPQPDEGDDVSLMGGEEANGAVRNAAAVDVLLDLGPEEQPGVSATVAATVNGVQDDDELLDLGGAAGPKAALVNVDQEQGEDDDDTDVEEEEEEEEEDEVAKWKRLSKEQSDSKA